MPRQKPQPLPIVLEKEIRFLGRFISATLDDPTINKLRALHTDKKPVKTIVRMTSAGLTIGEKPSKLSRIKSLYEFIPSYDVHTMTIDRLQRDVVLCIVYLGIAQYEITALRFNTDAEASIFVHAFDEVTNRKPRIDDRSTNRQPIASVLTKEADTNTTYSLASINPRASLGGGLAGSKEFHNWSMSRREQRRRHSNQTPTVYSFSTTGGEEKEEYLSASRSFQNVLLKANGVATLPPQQPGKPVPGVDSTQHQATEVRKHQGSSTIPRKQEPHSDDSRLFAYRKAPRQQRESAESIARAFEQQQQRQAVATRSVGAQNTVSEESLGNAQNDDANSSNTVVNSSTNVLRPSTTVNGVKSEKKTISASAAVEQDAWDYAATGSLHRSDRMSTVSQVSDSVRDEISSIHREVKDIKDLLGMLHKQFTDKNQDERTTGKGVTTAFREADRDGGQLTLALVGSAVDVDRLERQMERVEHKYGKENYNKSSSNSHTSDVTNTRHKLAPVTVSAATGSTMTATAGSGTGTVRRRPQHHPDGQQPAVLRLQSEIEEEEMEMRAGEGMVRATVADRREQQLTLVRPSAASYNHPHYPYGSMIRADYQHAQQYANNPASYQQVPSNFTNGMVAQPAYPAASLRGVSRSEFVTASASGYNSHQPPPPPPPQASYRLAPSNQHPPLHQQSRPIATARPISSMKTNVPIEIIELVPIKQDRGRSAKKSRSKLAKKSGSKSSKSRSTSREWSQNDSGSRGDYSRSASRDSGRRGNNVGFSIEQPQRHPDVNTRHTDVVSEIARHGVNRGQQQPPRLYEVVRI